jgi:1,4-dihydroxy-2-naphthoate octaprenyltransferase
MFQARNTPRWRAWLIAVRPIPLLAAVAAVIVGSAMAIAEEHFDPLVALVTLFCSVLLLAGINVSNDYFDYVKGVDTPDRLGPMRVTMSGLLPLAEIREGIVLIFAAAVAAGIYLVVIGGWPIAVIGALCILLGLWYSGGPFPFGHYGLGDLLVFLFFGFVAVGVTYYLQLHALSPLILLAGMPCSALATGILIINNLRDMETDRRTGKYTLAVRIGPRATRLEYLLLIGLTYAAPTLAWLIGWSSAWVLLTWTTLPLALRLLRSVFQPVDGPRLNRALSETMYLDFIINLLFGVGLIL